MNERFHLSRVFAEAPKTVADRVLATTFFAAASGSLARTSGVASLATRRARIAAAAADLTGSTALPSPPV